MAVVGTVVGVTEHVAGSELTATATTAGTLTVADIDEYDLDGGTIQIGTETRGYTVPVGTSKLVLASNLAGTYQVGEPVSLYPTVTERWADVVEPDSEEALQVRVPHTLYALLPVGTRTPDDATAEIVEAEMVESDHVVTDVLGRIPDYQAHVRAIGFDLPESHTQAGDADSLVSWLDDDDTVRESIWGYFDGIAHHLRLYMSAGVLGPLIDIASDGTIDATSGSATVLIWDNASKSNFLQVAGAAGRYETAFGTATVATNGVNNATLAVNHSIGRTPIVVLVTPRSNPNATAQVTARSTTTATLQVSHRDAGSNFASDTNVDWVAIG